MDKFAYDAHKGYTVGDIPVGPFHDAAEVIEPVSHCHRDTTFGDIVRLCPIEGSTVISATGAALKARIVPHRLDYTSWG